MKKIQRALAGAAIAVVMLAIPTVAAAQRSFHATVTWIDDGDTVWISEDGHRLRVRLSGVDCPELAQPFGAEARRATLTALLQRDVTVDVRDVDAYGRLVARIHNGGRDMSEDLLRDGLAWYYSRFVTDPVLASAESEARRAHRGLWSQPNPVPPWVFRAGESDSAAHVMSVVNGQLPPTPLASTSKRKPSPAPRSATTKARVTAKTPAGVRVVPAGKGSDARTLKSSRKGTDRR